MTSHSRAQPRRLEVTGEPPAGTQRRSQDDRLKLPERSSAPLAVRELRTGAPVRQRPAEQRQEGPREALRRRIRGEFEEMHGLRLTFPQAQRLFGLREDICARVLNELIETGILVRTPDRQYRRKHVA